MRESRKIASRINKMLEDEKYLKIVDRKRTSDDIIDIGDILKIKVIYDIDDIEEYTIKLTGKYMIDNNAKIKEISLNSPIGRSIYLKSINDNDICYYVNDKKIGIYLLNYGYVPNTISDDGEELDAYLLGVFDQLKEYHGKVIAIIHRTNDNDDKLVVVPDGVNYTDDQIMALTEFQERFFKSVIWR